MICEGQAERRTERQAHRQIDRQIHNHGKNNIFPQMGDHELGSVPKFWQNHSLG